MSAVSKRVYILHALGHSVTLCRSPYLTRHKRLLNFMKTPPDIDYLTSKMYCFVEDLILQNRWAIRNRLLKVLRSLWLALAVARRFAVVWLLLSAARRWVREGEGVYLLGPIPYIADGNAIIQTDLTIYVLVLVLC
jgi:uncharacterized membrane protein